MRTDQMQPDRVHLGHIFPPRQSLWCPIGDQTGAGVAVYSTFLAVSLFICGFVVNLGFSFTQGEQFQHALDATVISAGELVIDNPQLVDTSTTPPTISATLNGYVSKLLALNLKGNGISQVVTPSLSYLPNGGSPQLQIQATLTTPTALTSPFQPSMTRSGVYSLTGGGKPVITAFVVDTSRETNLFSANELQNVKDAAAAVVQKLSVGDYVTIVTFGRVYCTKIPATQIVSQPVAQDPLSTAPARKTKLELLNDINANLTSMNCGFNGPAVAVSGRYLQGGLFKARKEISNIKSYFSTQNPNLWNSYAKNILVSTDCWITSSSTSAPNSWPLPDTFDLDTQTKNAGNPPQSYPYGQCQNQGPMLELNPRAAALQQADLARQEGIEVMVVGNDKGGCSDPVDGSNRTMALKRIADDKDWDGTTTTWSAVASSNCGGYDATKWCSKGKTYYRCTANSECDTQIGAGDGQCAAINHSYKQRYWPVSTQAMLLDTLAGRIGQIKHGFLIQ